MGLATWELRGKTALVWLDQPGEPVNKISVGMIGEFSQLLDELEGNDQVRSVVFASRKDDFIVGADLEGFQAMTEPGQAEEMSRRGNQLLNRLAAFSKPVVAAIGGAALGGGLEFALACHFRIVSDSPRTVLGLPEVKLGLLPGGGGTQRLPRLIGLVAGLDLLLTGKNVYPRRAKKLGLVDLVVHPGGLIEIAIRVASELADKSSRPARRRRGLVEWLLEGNRLGRSVVFRRARKTVMQQTRGNYPAPLHILEVVKAGCDHGFQQGLEKESRQFDQLMSTPQSRNLIRLFFAVTARKKNPLKEKAVKVQRLGVLGAGLMGAGIAEVSASAGLSVWMKDVQSAAIGKAKRGLWSNLSEKVDRRILTAFERDRIMSRVHGVVASHDMRPVQLVVEAVFEDLELKKKIVAEVEAAVGSEAIFASNTSSLPIREIAAASIRPSQVIGMHYFSPVQKMPLLEVIVTPETADWVEATAREIGRVQGKTVIVVGDGPGFFTTRVLTPMLNEAVRLVEEGGEVPAIDTAMRQFGFPVGPLALMDEVGIDVGAHVGNVLRPLFASRGLETENRAEELLKRGLVGRKGGRGFYLYSPGKKKQGNPEVYGVLGGRERRMIPVGEIQDRLALSFLNEAVLCLQDGVLRSPEDGDLGSILGLGFPPFLGGPFRYVDRLGASDVVKRLTDLRRLHGDRFRPCDALVDIAAGGRSFYSK